MVQLPAPMVSSIHELDGSLIWGIPSLCHPSVSVMFSPLPQCAILYYLIVIPNGILAVSSDQLALKTHHSTWRIHIFICKWVSHNQPEHLRDDHLPETLPMRLPVRPCAKVRKFLARACQNQMPSNAKDGLSPSWVNMTAGCFDRRFPSHKVVHGCSPAHYKSAWNRLFDVLATIYI